jgi:hypothetical protein
MVTHCVSISWRVFLGGEIFVENETEGAGGKSLTRSEAMKRAWERRRSKSTTEAAWFEKPVCLCGCGEPLVRHPNPEKQRLFRPGHDARLKSVAAGVLAGEVPKDAIPQVAKLLKDRIGFLRTKPELAKAF